jgi:hypothetical protein
LLHPRAEEQCSQLRFRRCSFQRCTPLDATAMIQTLPSRPTFLRPTLYSVALSAGLLRVEARRERDRDRDRDRDDLVDLDRGLDRRDLVDLDRGRERDLDRAFLPPSSSSSSNSGSMVDCMRAVVLVNAQICTSKNLFRSLVFGFNFLSRHVATHPVFMERTERTVSLAPRDAQRTLAGSIARAQNAPIAWTAAPPRPTQTLIDALASGSLSPAAFQAARALTPPVYFFSATRGLVPDLGANTPVSLMPDATRGFTSWVWLVVQLQDDASTYALVALFYSPVGGAGDASATQWMLVVGTSTRTASWRSAFADVQVTLTREVVDNKETMTILWPAAVSAADPTTDYIALVRDVASNATTASVRARLSGLSVVVDGAASKRGPTYQLAPYGVEYMGPVSTLYWSLVDGVVAPRAATIDGVVSAARGCLWYDNQQLALEPQPPVARMLGSLLPYSAPQWLYYAAAVGNDVHVTTSVFGPSMRAALQRQSVRVAVTVWAPDAPLPMYNVSATLRVLQTFARHQTVPYAVELTFARDADGLSPAAAAALLATPLTLQTTFPRDARNVAFGIGVASDVPGVVLRRGAPVAGSFAVLEATYFNTWTPHDFAKVVGIGERYGNPTSLVDATPAALTLTAGALGAAALVVAGVCAGKATRP